MTEPNETTPNLTMATIALERGELRRAKRMLGILRQASPMDEHVAFQMTRLDRLSGNTAAAEAWLSEATKRHPTDGRLWLERTLVARDAGTPLDVPMPALRAVLEGTGPRLPKPPGGAAKRLKKAQAALARGDLRAVQQTLGPPTAGEALALQSLRAELALMTGRAADVLKAAHALEKAAPLTLEPLLLMARAQKALGKPARATGPAVRAAELAPKDVTAVRLALLGLLQIGATARARLLWESNCIPKKRLSQLEARLLMAEGRPRSAAKAAYGAKTPRDMILLAQAQARSGQAEAALTAYDGALSKGDIPNIRVDRAQLLQSMGRQDEAETALRDVLAQHQNHGMAARALAYGTKLSPDDPVIPLMETNDRLMQYARAKVAFDLGEREKVFPLLNAANRATAEQFPLDPERDLADAQRIMGPVTEALDGMPAGVDGPAPIFVTGMPRSGTTLVEAVLGAHSHVTTGGELAAAAPLIETLTDVLAHNEIVTEQEVQAANTSYVERAAEKMNIATSRFTDKSIHSFAVMGLLAKVLPNARFVVVHRDPRDVAFSIYRNHFADGVQRYASDLKWIAKHYGLFHRFVAHWRAQGVAFHEITYENLIDAPEMQTRSLLEACDLPWEPACLEFHRSTAKVDTLSFAQVRQPIYSSSKGGWQAYAQEMQPFIEALAAEGINLDRASDL